MREAYTRLVVHCVLMAVWAVMLGYSFIRFVVTGELWFLLPAAAFVLAGVVDIHVIRRDIQEIRRIKALHRRIDEDMWRI